MVSTVPSGGSIARVTRDRKVKTIGTTVSGGNGEFIKRV